MNRNIQLQRGTTLLASLVALTLSSTAFAAVPGSVFVEGYLHTTGGGPVSDGSYDVTYSLYEAKTGGAAAWSEGPLKVAVKAGQWTYALGATKPIKAATLAGAKSLWLGVTVGTDPELARIQVHSTFYAQVAGGVACTGCIETSAIKAGSLNLAGGTLTADKVVAKTLEGDGSGLTGIKIPSGSCPSGQVVNGIDKDGKLLCASSSSLPDDGVDKVSQGLIAIVGDLYNGNIPVNVNDNNPKGTESVITLNNVGKVDKLTVTVGIDITAGTSGIAALRVCLIAPGGKIPANEGFANDFCTGANQYLLHNKTGAGKKLLSTWPSPAKEVSGNIAEWIGKDPSGKWTLQVVDTNFDTNGVVGAINKFTFSARTTGNNKVNIVKELIIDGQSNHNKGLKLGNSSATCNSANEGVMRYSPTSKDIEFCDGSGWRNTHRRNATYRWSVWSTHDQAHGWFGGNRTELFGGIAPSNWGDNNYCAHQMSSTTDVLRTLYTRYGPRIGTLKNAQVYGEEHRTYSSTNSRQASALFRVRNTTSKTITWTAYWYGTGYGGWGERRSVMMNGTSLGCWSGNYGATSAQTTSFSVPPNRTSTMIFVVGTSSRSGDYAATYLAFYNNSLTLPAGLEFVDDLDTKPNGWDK